MGTLKYKGKLIPADLEQPESEIEIDGTLRALQQSIGGGYVEMVRTSQGMMVVDEEGLLKGLPMNDRASKLYPAPTGIAGDAVLFTFKEFDAFDRDLGEDDLENA